MPFNFLSRESLNQSRCSSVNRLQLGVVHLNMNSTCWIQPRDSYIIKRDWILSSLDRHPEPWTYYSLYTGALAVPFTVYGAINMRDILLPLTLGILIVGTVPGVTGQEDEAKVRSDEKPDPFGKFCIDDLLAMYIKIDHNSEIVFVDVHSIFIPI